MRNDRPQYSVLLVSSSRKGEEYLQDALSFVACSDICTAHSAGEARRRLLAFSYDLILINAPLSDENGEELALDAAAQTSAGILLLVREADFDRVTEQVLQGGVLTLQKPVHKQSVLQAFYLAAATRARMQNMEDQNRTLRKKMDEMRLVNRAKWVLIDRLYMDEPQAHRYLEKLSMDLRITKREAAEQVIRSYE